jgi:hypothetical protein
MLILNAVNSNIHELEKINSYDFPTPDISNPLFVSKKICVSHGKVVGFAAVKLTSEGILILDKDQPRITRSRAVVELFKSCKQDLAKLNLDDCHVFVKDEKVSHFLEKIGFKFSKGGQVLVYDLLSS